MYANMNWFEALTNIYAHQKAEQAAQKHKLLFHFIICVVLFGELLLLLFVAVAELLLAIITDFMVKPNECTTWWTGKQRRQIQHVIIVEKASSILGGRAMKPINISEI